MQLLQRAENRQREEFEEKMSVQRHQLEKQLEQRRQVSECMCFAHLAKTSVHFNHGYSFLCFSCTALFCCFL
jgi:hypothetical protein